MKVVKGKKYKPRLIEGIVKKTNYLEEVKSLIIEQAECNQIFIN